MNPPGNSKLYPGIHHESSKYRSVRGPTGPKFVWSCSDPVRRLKIFAGPRIQFFTIWFSYSNKIDFDLFKTDAVQMIWSWSVEPPPFSYPLFTSLVSEGDRANADLQYQKL